MKKPDVRFKTKIPDTEPLGTKEEGRPEVRLRTPFFFWLNGVLHEIPAGFIYDLGSIPRFAWWLLLPNDPDYAAEVTIHDWLYRTQAFERAYCDLVFLAAMEFGKTPAWKRNIMYPAVKHFGGKAFKRNSLERVMADRRSAGIFSEMIPLWDVDGKLRGDAR